MKKVILLCVSLAVMAPSAFAAGIDMSGGGFCPGIAGAQQDMGTLDCAGLAAGGDVVHVFGVFTPAEPISDLAACDGVIDILTGPAAPAFWQFDPSGCNPAGAGISGARPAAGCTGFLNVFTGGQGLAGSDQGGGRTRMGFSCFRAGTSSVTPTSKVFAFDLTFDPATSTEGGTGGTCAGCSAPVAIKWIVGFPRSLAGNTTTDLNSSSNQYPGFGTQVVANGGAVPTKKHTWGQLKSLYR